MREDFLNKPKQVKYFREFKGELMNVGKNYDGYIEKANTRNRIEGV